MNILKNLTKSWKTTLFGVLTAMGVIFGEVSFLFDANEVTSPEWNLVVTQLTIALGLLFARDNDVSSEQAGAALEEIKEIKETEKSV